MAEEKVPEIRPIVTREEAKALGLKQYFEGQACAFGHVANRLVRNQRCTECARLSSQAWRDANPDKSKSAWGRHRADNRDKINERNRLRKEFPCRHCGKHIDFPEARPGVKRVSRPKYCSDYCRLYSKVSQAPEQGPSGDCWEFQGGKHRFGYGMINMSGTKATEVTTAHAVAWEIANGPIPNGMFVLHRCDNPACCRPDHLFLGTHQDNMDDMKAKGRGRNGSSHFRSKLSEEDAQRIKEDPRSHYEIAADYGLVRQAVSSIKAGKTWKHLK